MEKLYTLTEAGKIIGRSTASLDICVEMVKLAKN